MDYEKKYKEALERAQQAVDKGQVSQSFVDDIFPEHKESRDERIKDEILRLVSISGNGNQYEEIRDWIEKQGENKKLDADKVIAWLVANICDFEYYVKLFKKDFGLC